MTADTRNTRHTPPDRHMRSGLRRLLGFAVVGLFVLAGCKNTKESTGGPLGSTTGKTGRGKSDPLVSGPTRIPPQNVPVPDRGTAGGTKGRADPLLGTPTGRPGEKTGAGYTDDPERWKGPYLPSAGSVPAALANRPRDGDELKIESPNGTGGVPLKPAGGVVPEIDVGPTAESLLAELAKLGVKPSDYTLNRTSDGVEFEVRLPINTSGAVCRYTGLAPTDADAIKQVLDQIKADRK